MKWGRTDKKAQVAPMVPRWQRELVHDVGVYLRLHSDGEAGRRIVLSAANDVRTLNRLSCYFWRDYVRGNVSWLGHNDHANLDDLTKWPHEPTERLKMRFVRDEWRVLSDIAFALARPVAHATAALLTLATRDQRIMHQVAPGFVARSPYTTRRGFYQWAGGQMSSSRFPR
jgi:hypothetical protein